jgi:signal peptidase I
MELELQPRLVLACELVADVVGNFGKVRLRVTGSSMIPAIWPGDVIMVRRCEITNLQSGQIVLYRQDGRLRAHRIVSVQDNILTTRGDALLHDDPPITASDIVGEVVCIAQHGRRLSTRQSFRERAGSYVLRRSGLCLRMTLRVGMRLRRRANREYSWAR